MRPNRIASVMRPKTEKTIFEGFRRGTPSRSLGARLPIRQVCSHGELRRIAERRVDAKKDDAIDPELKSVIYAIAVGQKA